MRQFTLKSARVQANLTQPELAEKMGVSRKSVSNWENGKKKISKNHFLTFCRVTGFETGEIFLGTKST